MPDGYGGRGQGSPAGQGGTGVAGRPGARPRALGDGSGSDNVSCYLRAYYQRVATEDLAPPSRLAAVAAGARPARPAPAAGPGAGPGPRARPTRTGRGQPVRPGRGHRHRRHALPGRLGHHRAEPARGRDQAARAPAAAGAPGRDRRAARDPGCLRRRLDRRPGRRRRRRAHRILDPRRARPAPGPGDRRPARGRPAPRARRRAGRGRGPARGWRAARPRRVLAAERLAGEQPGSDAGRVRRRCCAGWPTATSPSSATASTTWCRPRTAPACAPCPAPGSASCATTGRAATRCGSCRPRSCARAQDPAERLVLAKANSRSTVYRANYLDYVSVKKLDAAGEVTGEFRFLGLYTHAAHTAPIAGVPVLRRKLAQVLAAAGLSGDSHDGKDLVEILEDYPREELFEISRRGAHPDRARRAAAERAQADPAVPAPGPVRPVHVLPGVPAQGPVHHRGQAARAGHPARGAARGLGGLQRHGRRLGPGPAVRGGPGRAGTAVPQVDAAAWSASWPRRSGRGTRTSPPRRPGCSARSGPARCSTGCAAGIPETYKADVTAADAVDDLPTMLELRESADGIRGPAGGAAGAVDAGGVPVGDADHAVRRAAAAAAHGPRGRRRASVPVHRELERRLVLDLRIRSAGRRPRPRPAALRAALRGRADRAVARPDRRRRVQRAGAVGGADLARGRRCCAPTPSTCARAGSRFSEDYLQRVLRSNGAITRLLVRLFESRFDPARQNGVAERCEAITEEIRGQLDEVASLDADRILRSYLALIDATLRTNYYQQDGPGAAAGTRTWCSSSTRAACPG